MDLGGASTQITFDPRATILEDLFLYTAPDDTLYRLYTHSFLSFGNERMRARLEESLAKQATPGSIAIGRSEKRKRRAEVAAALLWCLGFE